jgi:coproporphyrinogen III oxidase-like Fe-S oxidoreductase
VDFDLFIGVGAGAMSHVEGLFYANTFNLRKYEDAAAKGRSPVALARRLSPGEEQRLYALYKLYDLRLPKRGFRRRFGKPVYLAMPREVMAGLALGLLRDRGEELVVTRRGLYAISYLMKAFYIKISQIRAMAIRKGI